MDDDAARTAESTEGKRPAPARSVRPGGDEEYDLERLTLESLRRMRGRGLWVLLGVAVLLTPLVAYHVHSMWTYRSDIRELDQRIRANELTLWELEDHRPERLPLLREYHAQRREVAALRQERKTTARRYPVLLLVPFGLIQALLLTVLLGAGARATVGPLLTGLLISVAAAVPFLLPLMIEHEHSARVAMFLGIGLYAQLRHVLLAVPLSRARGLSPAEAFSASSQALHRHRGSIWVAMGIGALLFVLLLGSSQSLTHNSLGRSGITSAIAGTIVQSLPALLFLTYLVIVSQEAYRLVEAKDKRARAEEAGKVFA